MNHTSILQDKVQLQEAIDHSCSIREALERLGLRAAGSNYKQFDKYCKLYHIDKPKFNYSQSLIARNSNPIALKNILVENSSYVNRAMIKKRCFRLGLLEDRCYICELQTLWNGKPITLHLDHINGVYNDNRIDNLRLLCPNCHSQTTTYAGRKQRFRNECLDCNKEIHRKSYRCIPCSNKKRPQKTKIDWPDTQILKDMVRNSNYSIVARKLNVTDNAIRKRIQNH